MDDFLFPFIFGVVIGFIVSYGITETSWKKEMVTRGYAYYCQDTGDWAWIGECEE